MTAVAQMRKNINQMDAEILVGGTGEGNLHVMNC
jgi:hypothetical protein